MKKEGYFYYNRMGLYYEDTGDYERALKAFLNACQISPSAETWLSMGVCFYEVNYLKL